MPALEHVLLRAVGMHNRQGIPRRVDAHRDYPHFLAVRAKAENRLVQLRGDQRAGVRTVGVKKGQDDNLAVIAGQGDRIIELVLELKIGGRREGVSSTVPRSAVGGPMWITRGGEPD